MLQFSRLTFMPSLAEAVVGLLVWCIGITRGEQVSLASLDWYSRFLSLVQVGGWMCYMRLRLSQLQLGLAWAELGNMNPRYFCFYVYQWKLTTQLSTESFYFKSIQFSCWSTYFCILRLQTAAFFSPDLTFIIAFIGCALNPAFVMPTKSSIGANILTVVAKARKPQNKEENVRMQ